MSKPFNELRKRLSPEAQERAELLYYELLIGFGKPASKAADWIVDTYMRGAPVSDRLSIEHTIAKAVMEYHPELRALLAERDALREREQKITHLRDYHRNESGKLQRRLRSRSLWASTEDDYRKIEAVRQKMHEHNERADELQSILNATLSEGK